MNGGYWLAVVGAPAVAMVLASAEAPSFGELTLGAIAVVALAWVVVQRAKPKEEKGDSPTLDHVLKVIQDNTEINSRLVATVEQQTRVINDLVLAVTKLVGRIEGRD